MGALFFGAPATYFLYMKKRSSAVWNLNINNDYGPSTAILVPAYNEEKIIRLKLRNLTQVDYPKDKMEIIIVNDCSNDRTLEEVNQYIVDNPVPKITLFDSKEHSGKTSMPKQSTKNNKS